jgi:opacity protein-like surface antigen
MEVFRMRKLTSAFAAILIAFLLTSAAWAADVSGKWTGKMSGPDGNGDFELSFTFKQDGAKLTGTVQGPQGDPIEITDGKIDGDKLSFVVKIEANGGMKITHEGAVSGDEIKLNSKMEGGDFPAGSITLKRVK